MRGGSWCFRVLTRTSLDVKGGISACNFTYAWHPQTHEIQYRLLLKGHLAQLDWEALESTCKTREWRYWLGGSFESYTPLHDSRDHDAIIDTIGDERFKEYL
jgi:hypothetical protein